MHGNKELTRFLDAQNQLYLKALSEVQNGKKETHWMWFVFPQLKGLGSSEVSRFYGISDLDEARAYLSHPVLGKHLIEISEAVLKLENTSATAIFGTPDDKKLHSSMTLFSQVIGANRVFEQVLQKYFSGLSDSLTLEILEANNITNTNIG